MPTSAAACPFPGFRGATYEALVRELVDHHMHELSGAEFKVAMYVLRHTAGYNKRFDQISLGQLQDGITCRDGHVVDRGTGLCRETILRALHNLRERGLLVAVHHRREGRHYPTSYALRLAGKAGYQGAPARPDEPARVAGKVDPHPGLTRGGGHPGTTVEKPRQLGGQPYEHWAALSEPLRADMNDSNWTMYFGHADPRLHGRRLVINVPADLLGNAWRFRPVVKRAARALGLELDGVEFAASS